MRWLNKLRLFFFRTKTIDFIHDSGRYISSKNATIKNQWLSDSEFLHDMSLKELYEFLRNTRKLIPQHQEEWQSSCNYYLSKINNFK